jgi:hypothetical protein
MDDDAGMNSGSAYVFDTTTGEQVFKLVASDAAAGDLFGGSLAVSGTTVIIGAQQDDDGGSRSGSAYGFDTVTGEQLFKLAASDAAEDDGFGISVAVSASTVVVGAFGDDDAGSFTGSAYVFNLELCDADLNGDGILNFFDIVDFLALYNANDPASDLAAPIGTFNFFDLRLHAVCVEKGPQGQQTQGCHRPKGDFLTALGCSDSRSIRLGHDDRRLIFDGFRRCRCFLNRRNVLS